MKSKITLEIIFEKVKSRTMNEMVIDVLFCPTQELI